MTDTRFDRGGELIARDQLLRLRRLVSADGGETVHLTWKGPTSVDPDGHKARRELEYAIHSEQVPPEALLEELGFWPVFRIERYVEYFHLGPAELRLEWYPRMDTLIEVEGTAEAIEQGIRATGLAREAFTAESLTAFVERFNARNQAPAALDTADLGLEAPSWMLR
jgi:adenylate cyclase class IV